MSPQRQQPQRLDVYCEPCLEALTAAHSDEQLKGIVTFHIANDRSLACRTCAKSEARAGRYLVQFPEPTL